MAGSVAALIEAYKISGLSGASTPGMFPMLAAGTMLLASLANVVAAFRTPIPPGPHGAVVPRRLVLFGGLVAGFLVALPLFGFLLSTAAFLYVAIGLLWRRGLVAPGLVTALALVLIWLTFREVFQIVLPSGALVPWRG